MRLVSLLTFVFSILINVSTYSQALAPDWTATDIDGNTYTLSDYLDNGKHVIIDFSATWCGPCWSYHNSGTLETMYDLYGPDGTDEIMIFFLESSYSTNEDCIRGLPGCNNSTYGDWTAGVEYPIINLTSSNGGNVWQQYGVPGFPTVSVLSATSGQYWNLVGNGAAPQSVLESYIFQSFNMESDAVITNANCGEDGMIESNVTGGFGSLNINWSNGMSGATISNLDAGFYTMTASDSRGHQLIEDYEVEGNSNGPLTVELLDLNDIQCHNDFSGVISVAGDGGNGGYTYTWSNGLSGSTISGLSGGDYTLIMTDVQGCETTESYFLAEPEELTVEYFSDDESCNGSDGSVIATSDGGTFPYSYSLLGSTNSSGVFFNMEAGTYELLIEDSENCVLSAMVTVEQVEAPLAVASTEEEITSCINGEATVSGLGSTTGGNISYQWTTTDGNILSGANQIDAIVSAEGNYTLRVTDNNTGCEEIDETAVISNTTNPVVTINSADNLTCGTTMVSVDGTGSETGSSITYTWTTTDGTIVNGGNQIIATVSAIGSYTLEVMDSETGCSETSEITVASDMVEPVIDIHTPERLSCNITSMILNARESNTGSNFSYEWTTTDGNIASGGTTLEPTIDAIGTYQLQITNADNGCISTQSVTVSIDDALPEVTVTDGELSCVDTKVTICADIADGSSAVWMIGGSPVMSNCAEVEAAGTYTVAVTGTNGCVNTAESVVTLSDDLPQVEIASTEALTCTKTTVSLEATVEGDMNDFTIEWLMDGNLLATSDLTIDVTTPGSYEIHVTNNANGCKTVSAVSVIEIIVNPVSSYELDNTNGQLNLSSTAEGDPQSYQWTINGEEVSVEEITELSFDENGVYTICLVVTNDCGTDMHCTDYNYATALVYDHAIDATPCFDSDGGNISVTPSGGEGNYTIAWTGPNGFTSDMLAIDGLAAGEYAMELSDSYGYELSESYTIVEAEAIELISSETTDETDTSGGSVTIEVGGGAEGFTYLWSDGSTDASLTDVSAGDYTVDVTDGNGCKTTFGPFTVASSVGVADITFASAINVYPVPASNYINIDITLNDASNLILNVRDISGKLIVSRTVKGTGEISEIISVENMLEGVYFLEITNDIESTTERFMVIR